MTYHLLAPRAGRGTTSLTPTNLAFKNLHCDVQLGARFRMMSTYPLPFTWLTCVCHVKPLHSIAARIAKKKMQKTGALFLDPRGWVLLPNANQPACFFPR